MDVLSTINITRSDQLNFEYSVSIGAVRLSRMVDRPGALDVSRAESMLGIVLTTEDVL